MYTTFPELPRSNATPTLVRGKQGLKLSSLHGKRRYPKAQFSSDDSISSLLTPSSSADTLPKHTSPTSHRSHSRRRPFVFFRDHRPFNSRIFWVVLWFFLNFSLTINNKVVLNRFPFPYIITALHALGGCLGTWFMMRPEDRLPALTLSEIIVLVFFSTLFTLNIVVSNVSLQLVTVPVSLWSTYVSSCGWYMFMFINALTMTLRVVSAVPSNCPIFIAALHSSSLRCLNSVSYFSLETCISGARGSGRWFCVSCNSKLFVTYSFHCHKILGHVFCLWLNPIRTVWRLEHMETITIPSMDFY